MSRKIIYVDMDGVLVDFPKTISDVDDSIREECERWCAKQNIHHSDFEGLFATLKPKEGAVAAIDVLMASFEVYLLSTAPWANTSSWTDKRRWVEKYLPNLGEKRLILTHRKDLNRGAFLIDDRHKKGAREFGEIEGQEWVQFNSAEFSDWPSVLSYLEGKS